MSDQDFCRYSHTVGFYSEQQGRGFHTPVDIAPGPDGLLYVLSRAGSDIEIRMSYKRVTICTLNEEYIGSFSTGGTAEGEMMWPAAIALDASGNVYVSDEALHRISVFDKDGQFLTQWGAQGSGDGEFDRPAGIVFDRDGNLLVADGLNGRVQRYTSDGTYLGSWGRPGAGDGELDKPWGLGIDGEGSVYVADWGNDRVQKFSPEGGFLASYGALGQGDGEFHRPAGVTVDQEGNIYVADWGNERVQVLGPDGEFVAELRGEATLSKWSHDYFVANSDELEIRESSDLEPEPELGSEGVSRHQSASVEKLFWGPTSVKVDSEGRIYVADSCRHRVQIYVREGQTASVS